DWLGRTADRTSRQMLLFVGLAVTAIAPLCYWLFPSLPVLIGLRLTQGAGVAAFSTGYVTLVMDIAPPQHRGKALSYMGLTKTLGAGFGAWGGSFLQKQAGYSSLFLLASGLALVGWLYCWRLQEPPREKASERDAIAPDKFWQLLCNRRIGILVLLSFLIGLTSSGVGDFLPLFIEDANIAFDPGFFYLAIGLATLASRLVVGGISDRSGRGLCSTIGFTFYFIAMLVLWMAQDGLGLLLVAILEGFSAGTLLPTLAATIGDRTHKNERGRAMSFWMGGFDLGMAIAAPIAGWLANTYGYRSLFAVTTGIAGLTLLLFITYSGTTFYHSWQYACRSASSRFPSSISTTAKRP
ncbi:MFS transporter, partial [Spirulina sp. 06S082]|uniref:MFS transporter n=1 Tax=Spirulina sp. 06S082 TaxID=3110248 RepID=UPI002B1F7C40